MADHSGTPTPATPTALEREVDTVRQQFETLQRQQAAGRTQLLATTLVILVLFGIFALMMARRYKTEFNEQDVRTAFTTRAEKLRPQVESKLRSLVENVGPTYREQAVQKLRASGPQIADEAVDKLREVPRQAGDAMSQRLRTMMERVAKRVQPELQSKLNVPEDRQRALLEEFQTKHVLAQTERLNDHVTLAVNQELVRMDGILSKFNAPTAQGRDADELKREWVLALVDYLRYMVRYGGLADPNYSQQLAPPIRRPSPTTQAAAQ